MDAIDVIIALDRATKNASNMWERMKLLSDFYDTGALTSTANELAGLKSAGQVERARAENQREEAASLLRQALRALEGGNA